VENPSLIADIPNGDRRDRPAKNDLKGHQKEIAIND
jgi:hypothetical protein